MPEFILDRGSPDAAKQFDELDAFTQGYIEAMFFTNTGDVGDVGDGNLHDATVADLAPDAWAKIIADCAQFQTENAELLAIAYTRAYDAMQAGRDFWFTRNGHGVGFWDRKELDEGELGEALSDTCRWKNVDLYRGDDGKVYLS